LAPAAVGLEDDAVRQIGALAAAHVAYADQARGAQREVAGQRPQPQPQPDQPGPADIQVVAADQQEIHLRQLRRRVPLEHGRPRTGGLGRARLTAGAQILVGAATILAQVTRRIQASR
jgi:hypothetical protein